MHEDKIRVIVPYLGGGFGSKAELLALEFCSSLLSKKLEKPVRIVYTREEVFTASRRRHPMIVDLKTGVKRDGSLIAQEARIVSDTGAYNSTGTVALYVAGVLLNLPYKIPNLRFEGYSVLTNNPVSGAMRGHGAPQSRFAADCQLDMIAADLGMDPMEIRLKNGIQEGEMTPNKMAITSCGLTECIQKAADDSKWKQKWGKMSRNRGIGMGCHAFISGASFPINPSNYAFASASVEVHEKGRVSLLLGAIDMGQGSNTVLAQIAAEELGVPLENIRVVSGDQGVTPVDMGSFGSRVTFMTGNAVKAAAAEAKKQLFETAAEMLEANVEDLQAKDQRISVRGNSEKGMPLGEVVVASQLATGGRPVLGKGYYNPKVEPINVDTGEGNPTPSWSFAAHIAEVEVDETSGEVTLHKLTVAHDCGRVINPMALEGQLEGSVVMAQGQALYENLLYEEGRTFNPSFLSYRLPLSLNMPEIRSIVVETVDPGGPFGAKEGGEGNLISTMAAIANAVYDAIGVRIKDLPITPEKILKALEERQR